MSAPYGLAAQVAYFLVCAAVGWTVGASVARLVARWKGSL